MNKFNPHKNCSCSRCKSNKTRKKTKPLERNYRRSEKIKLKRDQEEFENGIQCGEYFD